MAPCCSSIFVIDRLLLSTATSNGDSPSLFKLFENKWKTNKIYEKANTSCNANNASLDHYWAKLNVSAIIDITRKFVWPAFWGRTSGWMNLALPVNVDIGGLENGARFIQVPVFHGCEQSCKKTFTRGICQNHLSLEWISFYFQGSIRKMNDECAHAAGIRIWVLFIQLRVCWNVIKVDGDRYNFNWTSQSFSSKSIQIALNSLI